MMLIKAKIRGVEPEATTTWFNVNERLTILNITSKKQRETLLRLIATINPLYSFASERPFSLLPMIRTQNGQQRRVLPDKHSAAIGIFAPAQAMVQKLAALSPLFYEMDRIEVGRRLDESQWINFVELASSTRWSEIRAGITALHDSVQVTEHGASLTLPDEVLQWHPTERIKQEKKDLLLAWLHKIQNELPGFHQAEQEELTTAVRRIAIFNKAKAVISRDLPFFVELPRQDIGGILSEALRSFNHDPATSRLDHDKILESYQSEFEEGYNQAHQSFPELLPPFGGWDYSNNSMTDKTPATLLHQATMVIALQKTASSMAKPILLLNIDEEFNIDRKEQLESVLSFLSGKCQCICATNQESLFEGRNQSLALTRLDEKVLDLEHQ